MGVHILHDPTYYESHGGGAVLVDSVTGTAFGPLMHGYRPKGKYVVFDARQMAQGFLESFPEDARMVGDIELDRRWCAFSQREDLVPCPGLCDDTPLVPPKAVCDDEKCKRHVELLSEEDDEARP